MSKLTDGTQYRETPTGLVLTRGKREVYILAKSVESMRRARKLAADHSFDRIFKASRRAPRALGANVRYFDLKGASA